MCLLINKNQKPQIATEPIICYKCLTMDMLSPCYRQKYEFDKLLTSEFSIEIGNYCDKVKKPKITASHGGQEKGGKSP